MFSGAPRYRRRRGTRSRGCRGWSPCRGSGPASQAAAIATVARRIGGNPLTRGPSQPAVVRRRRRRPKRGAGRSGRASARRRRRASGRRERMREPGRDRLPGAPRSACGRGPRRCAGRRYRRSRSPRWSPRPRPRPDLLVDGDRPAVERVEPLDALLPSVSPPSSRRRPPAGLSVDHVRHRRADGDAVDVRVAARAGSLHPPGLARRRPSDDAAGPRPGIDGLRSRGVGHEDHDVGCVRRQRVAHSP